MTGFPLGQWFDVTKRIEKEDMAITEAQLMLNSVKQGDDPEGEETLEILREMRSAVKVHNKRIATIT